MLAGRNRVGRDRREGATMLERIGDAAAAKGLIVRGGFHPRPEDAVPPLRSGETVETLVILGNAGPEMWRAFEAACESDPELRATPDPLDDCNAATMNTLADTFGAEPLSPFEGPPYHPFQRWAQRAADVYPSPIGMLIHHRYGLWHAYRGALSFGSRLALPPRLAHPNPCETCVDRPCLATCPVSAFTPSGFDDLACARHVRTRRGASCHKRACLARRACPVGREYTYAPAQAEFHMDSFLGGRP